jgi:hypothetical protein
VTGFLIRPLNRSYMFSFVLLALLGAVWFLLVPLAGAAVAGSNDRASPSHLPSLSLSPFSSLAVESPPLRVSHVLSEVDW